MSEQWHEWRDVCLCTRRDTYGCFSNRRDSANEERGEGMTIAFAIGMTERSEERSEDEAE